MIEIKINDQEVTNALARLFRRLTDLTPVMDDIGEYMVESTKQRFNTGVAPDGRKWLANSETTILRYLHTKGGGTSRRPGEEWQSPYYNQDGVLNKKGAGLVAGKRPLIGESKRLSTEIHYQADSGRVVIGSSLIYSAVQQFGAKAGSFGRTRRGALIPWGDIPARPFLGLSDKDKAAVLDIFDEHLELNP